MNYLLVVIALMSTFSQLCAKVDESCLPRMDRIHTHDFGKKINSMQRESMQQAAQHQPQKLRVMTYNMLYNVESAEDQLPVRHQWEFRKPRLLEYLVFAKADLIGSQELQEGQIKEIMDALGNEYDYYGVRTRENEGRTDTNAIFYNPKRLELIDSQTIPYEGNPNGNAFTYCFFRDKLLEEKFHVVNTKLTWGDTERRLAEASQLSQFANLLPADEPILLVGDFNVFPFLEHENNLFFDGNHIEKILTENNLKDAKNDSMFGHFGPLCSITNSKKTLAPFAGPELTGFILDHIFVNNRIEVFAHGIDTAKVDGEFPSDHFPVIADIFFKSAFSTSLSQNCRTYYGDAMTSNTTLPISRESIDRSIQICHAFQQGTLSKDDAANQIETISTDYSQKIQIDSLANFVCKAFGMSNVAISPVTTEVGWSGDKVFLVKNRDTKETKLFLKVFEKDSKNFLPELYGLDYLQGVKGIASQQLEGLGKFYLEGRCHFVIAETPAKGHSFQHYYNELAKCPAGSQKRQKALQILIQGSRICGIALANLHAHVKGKFSLVPEAVENKMKADLERAISKLKLFPQEGIEIEKLEKCVAVAMENMKADLHLTGVAHGDIKLMHVFYHPDDGQISLIGSHQLINSIGKDGSLQGVPAKDYYTFVRSLYLNRIGYSLDDGLKPYPQELLTHDEASQVIEAFQKSYQAAGGISLTAAEESFLLLSQNLMFIGNLDKVLPEPDLTRLKALVALSFDAIRRRLESI